MTTATKTNTISFDQAMKLFKNFVSGSVTRPALKLVQFDGQYFTATNSHVLLRVNAKYVSDIAVQPNTLIDPTGKGNELDCEYKSYPDTSRLIPQNGYNTSTIVLDKNNLKELQTELKAAKKLLTKKNGYVTLELWQKYNKLITMETTKKERIRLNETELNSVYLNGEEIKINADRKYLQDAIETAKKLTKLNSNPLEMRFTSNLRPIHIKQEGILDIMVLPVRAW